MGCLLIVVVGVVVVVVAVVDGKEGGDDDVGHGELVVKDQPGEEGGEGDNDVGDGERARELVLGGLRLRHPHWPHLDNARWGSWTILRDNVTFPF